MGLGAGMMTGWADPSTGQLWPSIDPATGAVIGSGVVSARVVEAIPAVGRSMGVIASRMSQMPLTLWEAGQQMETPSLLARPDPGLDYPTLMSALCWDYWLHGNAVLYDTVVDGDLVLASMWVPAERVNCWLDPTDGRVWYEVGGTILDSDRVHHVKRRLDPWHPWRGVGVLEQHMRSFARISDQEAYQSRLLRDSGVPSVAVTFGNPDLSQEQAEQAKKAYLAKFVGPKREPIVLPQGSTVVPLAWSPEDAQMVEAAKASRGDVADMFNLDRWYLGVSDASYNYKSQSAMSLALVKDTLGEAMRTLESVLSDGWCEPGQSILLDTSGVIVDDKAATMEWLRPAVDAGIITLDEARTALGLPPMSDEQKSMALAQRETAATITRGEDRR